MQTFLPYASFEESAKCLDNKRLGKQRVETLQLIRGLLGYNDNGWLNHPASKMWKNYTDALIKYGLTICLEWIERGNNDSCFEKILQLSSLNYLELWSPTVSMPSWLNDSRLHDSHRSNLLRKDKDYYSRFAWNVPDNLSYWWPI